MATNSHNSNNNNGNNEHKVTACVTGASGFLGSTIALHFLSLGHRVRLPLRTKEQADAWDETYGKQYDGRIKTVLLKQQMQEEGAFDEAVKGCEVVVHAASPATFTIETSPEDDILRPANNGTLSILRSAQKSGTVKSVVFTSSDSAFASILAKNKMGPEEVLDDESWNEITYEEAAKMSKNDGEEIYSASKALSEKAAWEFMKDPGPRFTLCTLGPSCVLGMNPSPLVNTLNDVRSSTAVTAGALWDKGEFPAWNEKTFRPELYVSITSVAEAHVIAALHPSRSAGKRFLLCSDRSSLERVVREMVKHQPELKKHYPPLPGTEGEGEGPKGKYRVEASRAEKVLGFKYEPFEQYIKATADQVYALAKAGGQL